MSYSEQRIDRQLINIIPGPDSPFFSMYEKAREGAKDRSGFRPTFFEWQVPPQVKCSLHPGVDICNDCGVGFVEFAEYWPRDKAPFVEFTDEMR